MESDQFRGYWWPEGDEENKVPGVLNFDPTSRPELSLFPISILPTHQLRVTK
jgi:hypothetical protein